MEKGFRNRSDWWTLIAALMVWTAHFGAVWGASIIFPGQAIARWLALVFTIAAGAALAGLWLRAGKPGITSVGGISLAIAAGATAFDAMPALVG